MRAAAVHKKKPCWNFNTSLNKSIQVFNCFCTSESAMANLLNHNVLDYPGTTGNHSVSRTAPRVTLLVWWDTTSVSNMQSGVCFHCKRNRLSPALAEELPMCIKTAAENRKFVNKWTWQEQGWGYSHATLRVGLITRWALPAAMNARSLKCYAWMMNTPPETSPQNMYGMILSRRCQCVLVLFANECDMSVSRVCCRS